MVTSATQDTPIQTTPLVDQARAQAVAKAEFGFVWRSIRRLGVPQESVDDVVQNVFLVLWRRLPDIVPGQERSFLFSAALKAASEYRRKPFLRQEVPSERVGDDVADPSPDPEQLLQMRRDRAQLDTLLDALPLEQRTVFILYELEELTLVSIAELLGVPQGTVASRLRLARERMDQGAAGLLSERETGPAQEGR
jgi:RNA polymerase sigma-70 factor, ECF subfamily